MFGHTGGSYSGEGGTVGASYSLTGAFYDKSFKGDGLKISNRQTRSAIRQELSLEPGDADPFDQRSGLSGQAVLLPMLLKERLGKAKLEIKSQRRER